MTDSAGPASVPSRLVRLPVAVGRFFYDFFVGDTPELFLGGLAVVVVGAAMVGAGRWMAVAGLPLLVMGLLAGSVWRGRVRR
ncbi:MAG: hypothetical protein ACYCXA_11300 [Actinomycetes bacterium]